MRGAAASARAAAAMARPHVLWFDETYDEPRFFLDTARRLAARRRAASSSSARRRRPTCRGRSSALAARAGATIVDINIEDNPFGEIAAESGGAIRAPAAIAVPRARRRAHLVSSALDTARSDWAGCAAMSSPDDSVPEPVAGPAGRRDRRGLDAAARGGEQGHRRDPRGRREPRRRLRGRRARRDPADRRRSRSTDRTSRPAPSRAEPTTTSSSVDELRDAWPLLDLDERGDGLRVLPREDAEEFFISLSAARPGRAAAPLPRPASAASGCACSSPTTSPT